MHSAMDVKDLIPKHKDDQRVIESLERLSFEQIQPIIPDLLKWLQDINWPIARPVAQLLSRHADRITPDILEVLRTNDGIWKLWVLTHLARTTTDPVLLQEIERIALHPTIDELHEGVDLEARDILNGEYR